MNHGFPNLGHASVVGRLERIEALGEEPLCARETGGDVLDVGHALSLQPAGILLDEVISGADAKLLVGVPNVYLDSAG